MKIVTYNVNSLRQRVTQFGSLLKLLNSLQADIICLQETKLARQELTSDLTTAEGYEAFFSCTRSSEKGRVGYSGVATFCRVNSAFSSNEVALPLAAEEGFTGLLECSKANAIPTNFSIDVSLGVEGIENVTKEDLIKADSEGRCVVTDHGHFVLFNLYGPRAGPDDKERIRFKLIFFKILQQRWEALLSEGKRVVIVGDLNIAPAAVDCSGAGHDFEKNMFRQWLRSLLIEHGGLFFDAFRAKHPLRRDAYTCWSQCTGAEELNHGSRIDHILIGGPCLHRNCDGGNHSIFNCHVKECDILSELRRSRLDTMPRWKGGRSIKLEGSDHVPVFVCLEAIPALPLHSLPSLAARYLPEVRGRQQTIVSLLKRRELRQNKDDCSSHSACSGSITVNNSYLNVGCHSEQTMDASTSKDSIDRNKKRDRNRNSSQPTLMSFLQKTKSTANVSITFSVNESNTASQKLGSSQETGETSSFDDLTLQKTEIERSLYADVSLAHTDTATMAKVDPLDPTKQISSLDEISFLRSEAQTDPFSEYQGGNEAASSSEKDKNNFASLEWQRIQQLMQTSIPLCVGHGEPCVKRAVKKGGPNLGRGFYVCARPEGPASNPEARCNHFQWASSKRR